MELISKFESIALEKAIELKNIELDQLAHVFHAIPKEEYHLYNTPDYSHLNQHQSNLDKKLSWLELMGETRFSDWPSKSNINKKSKRKVVSEECKSRRNALKRRKKQLKRVERRVRRVKEENLVFNLLDPEVLTVPDEAMAVLSYGDGFINNPSFDPLRFRRDGFTASNKLAHLANKLASSDSSSDVSVVEEEVIPDLVVPLDLKLRGLCNPPEETHHDPLISQVRTGIKAFTESLKPSARKNNLSSLELKGLFWLRSHCKDGSICICKADKGGALIIMDPLVLKSMMRSKLEDTSLYELINYDPLAGIMTRLRAHWLLAVQENYIPLDHAEDTVGIKKSMLESTHGRPSTLDIFKPGIPSFTALPKLHKLPIEEILPATPLPFRMVTDLSRGPTNRADKYVAVNFLKGLQDDYCGDLVQDSTMFLQKLENISLGSTAYSFNLDVESLYDSIRRSDVEDALRHAISKCRPNWSADFVDWVLESVNISLDASVAKFGGFWYKAKDGVATGGKLCVYIANITVFYAFSMAIYLNWDNNLLFLMRFVDDGIGGWIGDLRSFYHWFRKVYNFLNINFNLRLTFNVVNSFHFIEFLDVSFRVLNFELDTDVFYKPTDAHRYLNFNSAHPPHVFKGIVFSQFLRVRRIVTDQSLFKFRLSEMLGFFINSDYPRILVQNVFDRVVALDRCLDYKRKVVDSSGNFEIPWVVTFGPGYQEVRKFVEVTNKALQQSPLFRSFSTPVLGVVTRRASNLKDELFNQKKIFSSSSSSVITISGRCTPLNVSRPGRKCECCYLMSLESHLVLNGKSIKCEGGNCKSRNINYCLKCVTCGLGYIGKTTQFLSTRTSQHRSFISKIDASTELSDENTLAAHAYWEHNVTTKEGFDDLYSIYIIKNKDPAQLTYSEQFLINYFYTVRPYGLNVSNPIGLSPVLNFT